MSGMMLIPTPNLPIPLFPLPCKMYTELINSIKSARVN